MSETRDNVAKAADLPPETDEDIARHVAHYHQWQEAEDKAKARDAYVDAAMRRERNEAATYSDPHVVELPTADEQAAADEAVRALVEAARTAAEATHAALDATQAAADVVALAAAREAVFHHLPVAVYHDAFAAAEKYVAECYYATAGDEEAHEYWQDAVVPRYLTHDFAPLDGVAHNAACGALAIVSREPARDDDFLF